MLANEEVLILAVLSHRFDIFPGKQMLIFLFLMYYIFRYTSMDTYNRMCPNLFTCGSPTLGSCMLTVSPQRLGKYQSTIDTGLPCNWIWMLPFPTAPRQTTGTGVEQNPSFHPSLLLYWHLLCLRIQWSSEETETDSIVDWWNCVFFFSFSHEECGQVLNAQRELLVRWPWRPISHILN